MLTFRPQRPIFIIGSKIYRSPQFKIVTRPQVPILDLVLGQFEKDGVQFDYFVNNEQVWPTNPRQLPRKSGRFVYAFDNITPGI